MSRPSRKRNRITCGSSVERKRPDLAVAIGDAAVARERGDWQNLRRFQAALVDRVGAAAVSDARVGPNSVIQPMPTTNNAALAFATWAVTTQTNGSFVFSHVSTSTSDCTFFYTVIG